MVCPKPLSLVIVYKSVLLFVYLLKSGELTIFKLLPHSLFFRVDGWVGKFHCIEKYICEYVSSWFRESESLSSAAYKKNVA